jgi:hypothetical protein
MRATEFMEDSCLRMEEDYVGKQQDLHLGCSVCGAKNWCHWGCPMLFMTVCPAADRIKGALPRHYLHLEEARTLLPFDSN